jgi:hypothetical protein
MPDALDPLVVRVVRRHLAQLGSDGRKAIEYQRRTHGLERVEHREEDDDGQHRDAPPSDAHPQ